MIIAVLEIVSAASTAAVTIAKIIRKLTKK